ncbi:GDP-mannose-dependent alpha-mannosyltransferase [mine drainage metagenome]|uniref:GDP-mannose-dependent alpha-mannosyltransferase n=1 Tax=mine drainage metagenome TaxID=410659 RepID=A0A1J5S0A2_9ZZZZ
MRDRLNLAIVTETFPPEVNGVAMTFGVIARELGLRGHRVKVYRPDRVGAEGGDEPAYEVTTLPGFPIPGYPAIRMGYPARNRLAKAWKRARPDLVHVVTEGPLGASAISAARALGVPVTSSFHTNFHSYASHYGLPPLRHLALAWLRRVHNRTRRTFAPTRELCDELALLGFRDLALLSRGVDLRRFSPDRRSAELRTSWGAGPDDLVVLHVGRMAPEKNYPLLFRIYDAMRAANPRLRFVLAGEGPLQETLRKTHPECIFAGFFSREEIGRYYASSDLYVHASTTETFGNVLTEAMASGLAVCGYNYAAAKQFVRHGENGLVAPLGDEAALTHEAVRLVSDTALRDRLRSAAPESLRGQSWERVIERFENDLVNIARQGGSS